MSEIPTKVFESEQLSSVSKSSSQNKIDQLELVVNKKMLRYFVDIFGKLPVILLVLIIVLPFMLFFGGIYFLKYLMYLIFRCYYDSKSKEKTFLMGGFDRMVYYSSNGTHENIIMATLYLRKQIQKEQLDKILEGLKKYPRFVSIPRVSYFGICEFIEYLNMNISDHTAEYYVPRHQIQDEIEIVRKKEINKSIPWWDVTILNVNDKMENENENANKNEDLNSYESVVIFRFHHIIGDGMRVISNMMPILFTNSANEPIRLNWNRKSETKSWGESFFLIIEGLWQILTSGSKHDSPMYKNKPKMVENEKYYSRTMPISLVKNVKNKFQCSFSAVVISAFAGALRRFSIENEHFDVNDINQGYFRTLVAFGFPVKGKMGNNFSNVSMPFYMNIENSIERLKLTQNELTNLKNGFIPHIGIVIGNFMSYLKPATIQQMSKTVFEDHTTVISTLPVLRVKPAYFCNTEIVNVEAHIKNFQKPFPEVITFQDKLTINVTCDETFYKQIEQIGHYFQSELQNMNME